MNYTEQMQGLLRTWSETQQKLAQQWFSVTPQSEKPEAWGLEAWLRQWRETSRATAEGFLKNAKGTPRQVGEKILEGSDAYLRFMDFFFDALKNVAPKLDGGADLSQAFRQYADALLKGGRINPADGLNAGSSGSDVAELWQLYLGQLKTLSQPWLESVKEAPGRVGEAMAGDRRAAIRMVNLFRDTYESTLGKFLSAPAIGSTREYQEKLTKAFESWIDARTAEAAFQSELMNAGLQAVEALARTLQEKGEKGEKVTSPKELFNLWVEVAEREYFRAASSEGFAQTQGRYVNATMHYRIHEQVLFESVYKACHLPTRRELDDAYRHLYVVRKEVKGLKMELASIRRELDQIRDLRTAEAKVLAPVPSRTKAEAKVPALEPTPPPARAKAAARSTAKTTGNAAGKKPPTGRTPVAGKE